MTREELIDFLTKTCEFKQEGNWFRHFQTSCFDVKLNKTSLESKYLNWFYPLDDLEIKYGNLYGNGKQLIYT